MDMLVVVSITAAYFYSVIAFGLHMAGKPPEEKAFFETSALLIFFVLLGRFIATCARTYAVGKVSFRSTQPDKTTIIEGDQEREIDSRLLQLGDLFKVLPDTKFPTDGVVFEGSGEVDESMLTGESLPVRKTPGSSVSAGTRNTTTTFVIEVSRLPGKNTVTDIALLVEEASKDNPRIEELANRIARHLVTIVGTLALVVFVAWLLVEFRGRRSGASRAVVRALAYAIAVLAVSCPCALGIAVPMVVVVAVGLASKAGVVVKSSESLISSRKITDVVFDKTGTITKPDLRVEQVHTFLHSEDAVYPIAKGLFQDNRHPISVAVDHFLEEKKIKAAEVTEAHVHPGRGVAARLGEATVKAGSPQWASSDYEHNINAFVDKGFTVLSVTSNDVPIVCFALRSRLQDNAVEVVNSLTRCGTSVHLVSGDQEAASRDAAQQAGIPGSNVASHCSIKDKVAYVSRLQGEGKVVMFCGDGVNDAGAVSRADVGVHIGGSVSSSDMTCDAANVVLLGGLKGIPYLLSMGRAVYWRIRFNFVWAIAYNVLAFLFASGLLVATGKDIRLAPQWAGLGELASVSPVIVVGFTMFFSKSVRKQVSFLRWPFRSVSG